jgi:DNA invertase Pin-like site-specific DNA recombinase
MLAAGDASALAVAKLDRLSRSMLDFARIMATAQKQSWALVALDVQVDTTSPGEAMAHMLATFSQFERRLISERTKQALARKRLVVCAWARLPRSTRRSRAASGKNARRAGRSDRSPSA